MVKVYFLDKFSKKWSTHLLKCSKTCKLMKKFVDVYYLLREYCLKFYFLSFLKPITTPDLSLEDWVLKLGWRSKELGLSRPAPITAGLVLTSGEVTEFSAAAPITNGFALTTGWGMSFAAAPITAWIEKSYRIETWNAGFYWTPWVVGEEVEVQQDQLRKMSLGFAWKED